MRRLFCRLPQGREQGYQHVFLGDDVPCVNFGVLRLEAQMD